MVQRDPETIRNWVNKGKLRAFKYGKQTLVNIDDLERLLDEPTDVGGRPKKHSE
jgi:excisionase family DNA binding protein